MHTPRGRLFDLVTRLDALGPKPTLVDLADAISSSELTIADVSDYVRPNERSYNRGLVVLREHYELLVMTWLPGQTSVPHDHAGSICVMKVLQGNAIEGSFRVAPDGYVDLDYETTVAQGEITAGADAGVHTVRTAADASTPLVTVHVYAPPLKDFRRFVPRPAAPSESRVVRSQDAPVIVVVGGGFSGSMTAAQILRRHAAARASGLSHTAGKLRVVVVERRGAVGEGLAYGTRELTHLLNVPAAKMTAWPDRQDDFYRWAAARRPAVKPSDFLPRQWYGEYVRESLHSSAHEASNVAELVVKYDEVRRVARRSDGGWLVHLAHGESLRADAVVLAIGHRPPSDPIGRRWSGPRTRFVADPWRPFAMNVVEPDESVVVLGAGLTAVDAVLSLAHPARTAPITILSRRGLLPHSHAAAPQAPTDLKSIVDELIANPNGVNALALCRRLRKKVREVAASGVDWRSVVDGVRPHTQRLWQGMSPRERQRFLSRLRPYWEVHRHRMALAIAERFGELRDCDWVHRVAGRVVSAHGDVDGARLVVCERSTDRLLEIDADWVVNCTGPAPSNSAASNPAIGSLLVDGLLRQDELGLGLDTSDDGCAVDAQGQIVPDLLIVGTLRKPALWESTAVPELRDQAAVAAAKALAALATPHEPWAI